MVSNVRTSCFLLLPLFCMFHYSASSRHEKKLSSAIVVGTVNCDISSFGRHLSKSSHFISGAWVAVECAGFRKEIKTNQRGVFRVRLPAGAVDDVPKGCSVRLIRSSEPSCSMASSSTSVELRLKSKGNGTLQVFSAGRLTFKPKPPTPNPPKPASPVVAERKQFFFPPPIPFLPPPPLPLPPNPLLPPPSLLPPVIPSPPPSLLPPFLPTPPPAPFVGLPPLPPLIPLPSPPPPASIFPPFPPFPPNPLFPGNPPASPPAIPHESIVV